MSNPQTSSQFRKSKTLNDKYLLGDEIGKGAYGRVYKGLDLENGDFVAIKQVSLENIPQEDLNSIMQEIDLLKNLNHKNIVQYRGSIKTKIYLYIILEYVENGSLASIVKPNKFGAFPESLAAVYIAQVLEGLVYLHEQGVIHRDIKGANILTTKEGLVKLADFGVATKLTEADVNTHSVVGTPYWMAPEVIEMSGVSAASDIWSVGCTVIELLTCSPPYYDLQPMPALFRIVKDDHPPIPEHLSPGIIDFLHQCFRKDAKLRPDARTLLKHPWIQNSRRVLRSSLRRGGGIRRNIPEDVSTVVERTIEDVDVKPDGENASSIPVAPEFSDDSETYLQSKDSDAYHLHSNGRQIDEFHDISSGHADPILALTENNNNETSHQELTLSIHETEMPDMTTKSDRDINQTSINIVDSTETDIASTKELPQVVNDCVPDLTIQPQKIAKTFQFRKADVEYQELQRDLKGELEVSSEHEEQELKADISNINSDSYSHSKDLFISPEVELSRFIDTAADGTLEDLFEEHFDGKDSINEEASPESQTGHDFINADENGENEFAVKLKEKMAQRKTDWQIAKRNGKDLTSVVPNDDNGLESLDFTKKAGLDVSPKQAIEVSKLINVLKPEESEDKILIACQKLVAIFQDYPDQKSAFVCQHGILILMEMLEVSNTRVILAILEVANQLTKDNSSYQENACLIGLIPVVTHLAGPEHSYEIRMQAAYFVQQLCQTRETLQMFIACRGLPVLVGFLEPNYMKYRELVFLAIDCIWKVFGLQSATPVSEFCRIFAKNGALIRLVNTLHSLNVATHLDPTANGGLPDSIARKGDSKMPSGSTEPPRKSISESHLQGHGGQASELAFVESIWNSAKRQEPLIITEDTDQLVSGQQQDLGPNAGPKKMSISDELKNSTQTSSPEATLQTATGIVDGESQSLTARPFLSLLDKEPPSKPTSAQLDYFHAISGGMEKHELKMPLLHHSNNKGRTNYEIDLLLARFAENGREKEALELSSKFPSSSKSSDSLAGGRSVATTEKTPSTSGLASQPASGLLSGSGLLNGRAGSATSSGVLSQMMSSLNIDVEREYLEKVADLLIEFCQADSMVKSYLFSVSLLNRLMQMLSKLEPPILLKILKCISRLSTDPDALEHMQRAEAIRHLIPFLACHDGFLIYQIHVEVLNSLYNLCKINKRRQEQAAENGIIPHLKHFIVTDSPLKQVALPLLCDMAHASRSTREQLRKHNGLDIYLNLLDDEAWALTALDSLAVCLAHDNEHRKVELALLRKKAVEKLVNFFKCCSEQSFVHILEPFLKIITKSTRINTALATSGLTPLLVSRLDHRDAIVRLNLLKLIKVVYEHHPRPKQLIVENDLPLKLQRLIQERRDGERLGGQVLVKQMATALIKALHINTVL